MRIDCQSHVFPREYAELLARNQSEPRALPRESKYLITYGEIQRFLMDPETYGVDGILADMDRDGIDMSALSVNMPGPESLPPELGIEGARLINDYLAEIVRRHSDRFVGIAALPWQNVPAALFELDRAVGELDLRGAMLYSCVGDRPVDAPELDPIYSRLEALDRPLVLHPTVPSWGGPVSDHYMLTMVGVMVEQSFATLRLILGGVLHRHPHLKVVQPHCGGVLPYLWGRIENQTEVMGRGCDHIDRPVREYYDRVYLDTVSPSIDAIRFAYKFAGADRLVFGSDHPWVDIGLFVKLIEALDIPAVEKEKIWSGNARRLFGIP